MLIVIRFREHIKDHAFLDQAHPVEARGLSLDLNSFENTLIDELTMANGYFLSEDQDTKVAFDVFYRRNPDGGGFSVFAGLEQVLAPLVQAQLVAESPVTIECRIAEEIGTFCYSVRRK